MERQKLPTTVLGLEYKGGHPELIKEKACNLVVDVNKITINCGLSSAYINFENFLGVQYESMDQISRRITATRLLLMGPFALAFKKKKKDNEKYLTIEFKHNGLNNTCIIGGKNVQRGLSAINEKYACYIKENPIDNSSDIKVLNPYEELKQLKEFLDMGIINQDEFDSKKKELLNL